MKLVRDPDFREIKACQDLMGDEFEQAFERLFHRYRHRVYSIAYRITGSAADAMDVVQESFSLVFRKVGGFRFDSLFSTWLFRIVVNCSIDHRRRERGRSKSVNRGAVALAGEDPEDPSDGPESMAETQELAGHVQDAIHRLSPKLRAVLALRYLEGMSYEELAATLEVSMGTVKSRLSRAHLALEKLLRGTLEGFGFAETLAETAAETVDRADATGQVAAVTNLKRGSGEASAGGAA